MKNILFKIYFSFVFIFFVSILIYLRVFRIATDYCLKALFEIYLLKIGAK